MYKIYFSGGASGCECARWTRYGTTGDAHSEKVVSGRRYMASGVAELMDYHRDKRRARCKLMNWIMLLHIKYKL